MKKLKLLTMALCFIMLLTVILSACDNSNKPVPDGSDGNNGNQQNGEKTEEEHPYQVADEEEWVKIVWQTINCKDLAEANFTIQIKYGGKLDGLSEEIGYTLMCADELWCDKMVYVVNGEIYRQEEGYSSNDGGYYRVYSEGNWSEWYRSNTTSEETLVKWRGDNPMGGGVFLPALNFLADSFNDFVFADGTYTAHDIVWTRRPGWTFSLTECNVVLSKNGIKNINGKVIEDGTSDIELNFSIVISDVGSTNITMPQV